MVASSGELRIFFRSGKSRAKKIKKGILKFFGATAIFNSF